MINDNYIEGCAKLLTGEAYTLPSHLAFGSTTGVLASNDTITSGEFDRNALDSKASANNVSKYIGTRSSVEASGETINVVGMHNTGALGASGDLQLNFLVPSLVHTTSFDVEVEAWVSFNRSV